MDVRIANRAVVFTIVGNRKKGSNGAFLIPFQVDENDENAIIGPSTTSTHGLGLVDLGSTTTETDTQAYSDSIDFGSMSFGDTSEDSSFDAPGSVLLKAWPTPSSIFSTLDDGSILSEDMTDEYYSPKGKPIDREVFHSAEPNSNNVSLDATLICPFMSNTTDNA